MICQQPTSASMTGLWVSQSLVDDVDHHLGPLGAAVKLVEYGDYQCPFCAQAQPSVREMLSRFGDRILFVFRHFPLVSQHPSAWRAALTRRGGRSSAPVLGDARPPAPNLAFTSHFVSQDLGDRTG
ncbi:MAG: DsbA family protein [Candidatus Dormibacter sp.]|uniref:DsbA family protein n=1 Tax=Candidatus Dormibacter sp. TaxID=2973982 RepID=UPI000DB1EE68|nr:MAG: hypothetical protein DLM66_09045 [Candidatus Dormibacteraeota bacterium]